MLIVSYKSGNLEKFLSRKFPLCKPLLTRLIHLDLY
nr:MAG TPA: hypothetical protein [Caudoviricetes sp.]